MKQSSRVVDLTHELSENFPTYANYPRSLVLPWTKLGTHTTRSEVLFHNTHAGTHIDAPAHMMKDGKTIDEFDPNAFVRYAVLLDLTHKKPGQMIDDEDLEGAEERAGLAVREDEFVLIQTGWQDLVHTDQYYPQHPGLSENGAEYLELRHVSGVGVDTPNLDHPENVNFPAHAILLRKEILILENLCNLEKIERARFQLIALPLRVKASGSPVRAIAVVDDSD